VGVQVSLWAPSFLVEYGSSLKY